MADAFSPPAPSPVAADDLADAPWAFSPWQAPHRDDGDRETSPLFTILPVSAFGVGLVLLVAVAVVLVVTRRAKPPRTADAGESRNGDGKPGAPSSSCGSHNTGCYAVAGKHTHAAEMPANAGLLRARRYLRRACMSVA